MNVTSEERSVQGSKIVSTKPVPDQTSLREILQKAAGKDEDPCVCTVKVHFFKRRPPIIEVEGEAPPSPGKFERQTVNIFRALSRARNEMRKKRMKSNG